MSAPLIIVATVAVTFVLIALGVGASRIGPLR
jgi:hypothetical protein